MKLACLVFAFTVFAAPALAQDRPRVLPANTPIVLSVNDTVTTKGRDFTEGSTFSLSVAQDVLLDGHVVIPRNSRAVGRITWLTSRGAFGKSGKMEVALQYVDVMGQKVPLSGTFRQEGKGKTAVTIATVAVGGLIAGSVVTGESAVIPRGHALVAHTAGPLVVRYLPAGPGAAGHGGTWQFRPYRVVSEVSHSIRRLEQTRLSGQSPDLPQWWKRRAAAVTHSDLNPELGSAAAK